VLIAICMRLKLHLALSEVLHTGTTLVTLSQVL